MGRPKGSKNKPKPLPPEVMAAVKFAEAQGFKPDAPEVAGPSVVPVPEDFHEFLQLVKIRSKLRGEVGRLVTPVLNAEQEEIYAAWRRGDETGLRHLLILKSRKIGVSTLFALVFTHEWLRTPDPITLVCLANKDSTASEIMGMVKTAFFSLPKEMQPKLVTNQVHKLARENPTAPGSEGAVLFVDTAKAERPLAGFTPAWLHLTEANFVADPDELRASAFSAVPWEAGGRIVIESTANRIGDLIHTELEKERGNRALGRAGELPWQTMFFPWFNHEHYRSPAPGFVRTEEEEALAAKHELSDEQLAWRRTQIASIGERKFPREYPASVEEAYANLEGQWFTASQLEHLIEIPVKPWGVVEISPPDGDPCATGVDCAAGVDVDATSSVTLNARTFMPKALYRSKTDPPTVGVDHIWRILCRYNHSKVLVERNSYGIPYLDGLRSLRANMYTEQAHETDGQTPVGEHRDFVTTAATRLEVLEGLRRAILDGVLTHVDSVCMAELRAAKVDRNGRVEVPRTKDGHGDVMMAYALALRCARKVALPPPPPSPMEQRLAAVHRQSLTSRANPGGRY